MLVIGRKQGQAVKIGDAVVHVVGTRRGGVRLAIDAPKEIPVTRVKTEVAVANTPRV